MIKWLWLLLIPAFCSAEELHYIGEPYIDKYGNEGIITEVDNKVGSFTISYGEYVEYSPFDPNRNYMQEYYYEVLQDRREEEMRKDATGITR